MILLLVPARAAAAARLCTPNSVLFCIRLNFKDLVTLLTGSTRMHTFDWRRGGRRRGLNAAG